MSEKFLMVNRMRQEIAIQSQNSKKLLQNGHSKQGYGRKQKVLSSTAARHSHLYFQACSNVVTASLTWDGGNPLRDKGDMKQYKSFMKQRKRKPLKQREYALSLDICNTAQFWSFLSKSLYIGQLRIAPYCPEMSSDHSLLPFILSPQLPTLFSLPLSLSQVSCGYIGFSSNTVSFINTKLPGNKSTSIMK